MCPNKASLSLFTPSFCSFSTASIFHTFSINLVLLLLHLICLQTACWFLKHSLYIKISLAYSQSVLFSPQKRLTQNPRPSNGKFCRICLFSKIPPPRSPTLFSSCYDWRPNCPGHSDSRCWGPVTSFHCFQTQDGRAEPLEMCPTHIFTKFLILTFICFQFSFMSSALKQALWPYRCTDCNPSSNTQNDTPVPHPRISYKKKKNTFPPAITLCVTKVFDWKKSKVMQEEHGMTYFFMLQMPTN